MFLWLVLRASVALPAGPPRLVVEERPDAVTLRLRHELEGLDREAVNPTGNNV